MGRQRWQEAMDVCEGAAAAFPRSHYLAVDLLVTTGYRDFVVAEVNAFGDLIPGVLHAGRDTYTHELATWEQD